MSASRADGVGAGITLVVTLTVRRHAAGEFRRFEQEAARVMARHGGAIERVVVIRSDGDAELFREVHIVTFPNEEAFGAYRGDPELLGLAALRDAAIVTTEVLVGEDGPHHRATRS